MHRAGPGRRVVRFRDPLGAGASRRRARRRSGPPTRARWRRRASCARIDRSPAPTPAAPSSHRASAMCPMDTPTVPWQPGVYGSSDDRTLSDQRRPLPAGSACGRREVSRKTATGAPRPSAAGQPTRRCRSRAGDRRRDEHVVCPGPADHYTPDTPSSNPDEDTKGSERRPLTAHAYGRQHARMVIRAAGAVQRLAGQGRWSWRAQNGHRRVAGSRSRWVSPP